MTDWTKLGQESKEQILKEKEETKIEFKPLAEVDQKRGLKIGIYGDFATGKTHFALTAPEPIFIIDTELGASPLAFLFKGKDIKILDVCEKDGSISFQKYVQAVEFLSQQEKIGTVIVDSMTDIWSFCQEYCKVNIFKIKPEQRLAQQWDWGLINKNYLKPLLTLINLNCNIILTGREQELYSGPGQPMGIFKPHWMKKTPFWIDFVIYNTKKTDKMGTTTFNSKIEKSRPVGQLMGKSFVNMDYTKLVEEINKLKGEQK